MESFHAPHALQSPRPLKSRLSDLHLDALGAQFEAPLMMPEPPSSALAAG